MLIKLNKYTCHLHFLCAVQTRLKAIHIENASDKCDIPWYATLNNCITIVYLFICRLPVPAGTVHLISTTADPITRIKLADKVEIGLRDAMLNGAATQTPLDLWTLIPPDLISNAEEDLLKRQVPHFKPGYLTDTVSY
jgi:hypothetical protein